MEAFVQAEQGENKERAAGQVEVVVNRHFQRSMRESRNGPGGREPMDIVSCRLKCGISSRMNLREVRTDV